MKPASAVRRVGLVEGSGRELVAHAHQPLRIHQAADVAELAQVMLPMESPLMGLRSWRACRGQTRPGQTTTKDRAPAVALNGNEPILWLDGLNFTHGTIANLKITPAGR